MTERRRPLHTEVYLPRNADLDILLLYNLAESTVQLENQLVFRVQKNAHYMTYVIGSEWILNLVK